MLEIRIAKPCDQSWTAMKGDDQVRHCQRCQKNVFNISAMTEAEVRELIERTEGRFCARVYRRSDGRVMTKDCPKGVAAARRKTAMALTAACAAVLYGVSFVRRQPKSFDEAKNQVRTVAPVAKVIDKIAPTPMMGSPAVPPTMGAVAYPTISRSQVSVILKRKP